MSLGKTHAENFCFKTNTGKNKSGNSKGNQEVRKLPYMDTRINLFLTQLDTTASFNQRHFIGARSAWRVQMYKRRNV